MLFASCVQHAPALQHQLTSLQPLKEPTSVHHHQVPAPGATALVNEEAREAMRKLDAKLIAYLAGEDMPAKVEPAAQRQLALESLQESVDELVKERFREQQLQLFKSICSIKLQMEALTLEAEGTRRMELLQSEIRPIFTVECQLSHELIKNVPRYDMFHIMQFESEKFHSLTQCTRFGQEAERDVKLCLDDVDVAKCATDAAGADEKQPNFGRIHFAVWWREPGTCLNELLGMGVLELQELYSASLLEQCKRIAVKRRGIVLANLYLKISLQLQAGDNNAAVCAGAQPLNGVREVNGDKGGSNGGEESSQQPQQQENQNSSSEAAANMAGAVGGSAAPQPSSSSNRDIDAEPSSFAAETAKVRVLRGFLYINESRNINIVPNYTYFVRPVLAFWTDGIPPATVLDKNGNFDYQEQFNLINDEAFIKTLEREHLNIEVGHQKPGGPMGFTYGKSVIPLHKFFVAFRTEAMTNHLCKGKLPVIAMDGWVPIVSCDGEPSGELKCLLAMGSEEQISNLKKARGFVPKIEFYTVAEMSHFVQKSSVPTPMPETIPRAPLLRYFFAFELDLLGATGLPMALDPKGKQTVTYFLPQEPPSAYVLFQAHSCHGSPKFQNGYFVSKIVSKCAHPQWRQRFRIVVTADYIKNPLKHYALDVMRKRHGQPLEHNPSRDVMIGTAALNLIPLLCEETISSDLNIVDCEDKINGVLHLRARWLKDLLKLPKDMTPDEATAMGMVTVLRNLHGQKFDHLIQAYKRKVIELPSSEQAGSTSDGVLTASSTDCAHCSTDPNRCQAKKLKVAPADAKRIAEAVAHQFKRALDQYDLKIVRANKTKVKTLSPPQQATVAGSVDAVTDQFKNALDLSDPNLDQAKKRKVNVGPSQQLAAVAGDGVPVVEAPGLTDTNLGQPIKNEVNDVQPPQQVIVDGDAKRSVEAVTDRLKRALDLYDPKLDQVTKSKVNDVQPSQQAIVDGDAKRSVETVTDRLKRALDLCDPKLEQANKSSLNDVAPPQQAAIIAQFDSVLNQAIQSKFNELQQISQRLRTRLSEVTGEQLSSEFDSRSLENWQPFDDSASVDDADAADLDQFERDINTAPSTSDVAIALEVDEANKNMISTKQESADRPGE